MPSTHQLNHRDLGAHLAKLACSAHAQHTTNYRGPGAHLEQWQQRHVQSVVSHRRVGLEEAEDEALRHGQQHRALREAQRHGERKQAAQRVHYKPARRCAHVGSCARGFMCAYTCAGACTSECLSVAYSI